MRIAVRAEHEERLPARATPARLADDRVEAPVLAGAAQLGHGRERETDPPPRRRAQPAISDARLHAGGSAPDADPRPAPDRIDVVSQRDREPRAGDGSVGHAELSA